jgi:hypothetical protein
LKLARRAVSHEPQVRDPTDLRRFFFSHETL